MAPLAREKGVLDREKGVLAQTRVMATWFTPKGPNDHLDLWPGPNDHLAGSQGTFGQVQVMAPLAREKGVLDREKGVLAQTRVMATWFMPKGPNNHLDLWPGPNDHLAGSKGTFGQVQVMAPLAREKGVLDREKGVLAKLG